MPNFIAQTAFLMDTIAIHGGTPQTSSTATTLIMSAGSLTYTYTSSAADPFTYIGGALTDGTIDRLEITDATGATIAVMTDLSTDAVLLLGLAGFGTPADFWGELTQGNDVMLGSASGDALFGGDEGDLIRGGDGNDQLFGGDGNDVLMGGAGADDLFGGAGEDTAAYTDSAIGLVIDLAFPVNTTGDAIGDTYTNIENIQGSQFNDRIDAGNVAMNLFGGAGRDILLGGNASQTLSGNGGRDRLIAGAGEDVLFGGGGRDVLFGGLGDDTLFGGAGDDRMDGGSDTDTFLFVAGQHGNDLIQNFSAVEDVIDIDGVGGAAVNLTTTATDTVLTVAGFAGNSITIENQLLTLADITLIL